MKKVGWSSILVATLVLAFGVAAEAQQPKKIPRIGYLNSDAASESVRAEAILGGSARARLHRGQNIATEYRYTEGNLDRSLSLPLSGAFQG